MNTERQRNVLLLYAASVLNKEGLLTDKFVLCTIMFIPHKFFLLYIISNIHSIFPCVFYAWYLNSFWNLALNGIKFESESG